MKNLIILKFFKKYIYLFLLLLLVFIIGLTNFKPNTYLLGWDSLSTEFNPLLGIKRSLWSGWQEYQSFGLASGMAHTADLIRSIFIYFLSNILPLNLVRYFFHLLCLLLGGVGSYYLFSKLFKNESNFISFIGSVFYILNLGTVQIFALAFEPFSIFFAFLPWLILSFINYIDSEKVFDKKKLTILVLVNFLATPFAYLQTLFFVYFLTLCFISIGILISKKKKILTFKKLLISSIFIFFINSFWIFPQIYFLLTSNNVVQNSTINQLTTQEIYFRNLEKGNILDFLNLEGFYFESFETATTTLIFDNWHRHFSNTYVSFLRFVPILLLTLGLLNFKKSNLSFYLLFLLSCIALLNDTQLFIQINQILRGLPLLNQIFRSPFTKFIVLYSLVYSYFIVSGILLIKHFFGNKKFGFVSSISGIFSAIFLAVFITIYLPVFKGGFFSSLIKVELPYSYIRMFEYFKTVPKDQRVALLPEYIYWGWYKNNWGYDGSGFIWYAFEQPVVSRTFDVWSYKSESFYWEIKDAVEDRDTLRFEKILEKYDISYLLYDKDLIALTPVVDALQVSEIEYVFDNSASISLVQQFDGIFVYYFDKTKAIYQNNDFVDYINPTVKVTNYDKIYLDYGNYYSNTGNFFDSIRFYPFQDLLTDTKIFDKNWYITNTTNSIQLKYSLSPKILESYNLVNNRSNTINFKKLNDRSELVDVPLEVMVYVEDYDLVVDIKKVEVDSIDNYSILGTNCFLSKEQEVVFEKYFATKELFSKNGSTLCVGFENLVLPHFNSYLFMVEVENIEGQPPYFFVNASDLTKFETTLENGFNYFILNSGYFFDDGYSFNFQNRSIKNGTSKNKIYKSELYLFPFDFVKSIHFENKNYIKNPLYVENIKNKINYYTYEIKDIVVKDKIFVLNQSYDPGWVAICGYKLCNASHVVVNNWANGWVFDQNTVDYAVPKNVKIVFWPQYLQYLGYFLALIPFIVIFKIKVSGTNNINKK